MSSNSRKKCESPLSEDRSKLALIRRVGDNNDYFVLDAATGAVLKHYRGRRLPGNTDNNEICFVGNDLVVVGRVSTPMPLRMPLKLYAIDVRTDRIYCVGRALVHHMLYLRRRPGWRPKALPLPTGPSDK